jgi:3-oxoacyl-ACP reductase-like protein
MPTKVEVQRNHSVGVDTHTVEGEPKGLSGLVNDAIKANDKFVTFSIPGGKKLSVIAERVEAIWEE